MTRMRLALALAALAAASALPFGAEAAACGSNVFEFGAEELGAAERERRRLARERSVSRHQLRARRAAAEAALAAGADASSGLAEMLVPNVRPVFIDESMCGEFNEIDHGEGRETERDWLVGTSYEGREREFRRILGEVDGELPGTPCNTEVRARFAGLVRRRLTARQQREAYLFLGARWPSLDPSSPRTRLTTFHIRTRRPPVHWMALDPRQNRQIVRWVARDSTGRAVQRAIDEFWQETEPLLGDLDRLCPAAAATWAAAQRQVVAAIEAEQERRAATEAARAD